MIRKYHAGHLATIGVVGAVAASLATVGVLSSQQASSPVRSTDTVNQAQVQDRGGVERWSVKVGGDPTAGSVNLEPQNATVDALVALPRPAALPAHPHGNDPTRYAPEMQTYRVAGVIMGSKLESDGDFHVVLSSPSTGKTMIVEIPNPADVPASSPWRQQIADTRATFQKRFSVSPRFVHCSVPAVVTGVLFFDFAHGQTGLADNAVELHPVLKVEL